MKDNQPSVYQPNREVAEFPHLFMTIWKLIGRRFLESENKDKPGLAISWPNASFPL
jgi:hypothetical protein